MEPSRPVNSGRSHELADSNGLLEALNTPLVTGLSQAALDRAVTTLQNKSEDQDARRFAARRLGDSSSPRAVEPLLVALLKDPSPRVRGECATALANVAPLLGAHRTEIYNQLAREQTDVRSRLYLLIAPLGDVPRKIQKEMKAAALKAEHPDIRARAMHALEIAVGPAAAIPFTKILRSWFSTARTKEAASLCLERLISDDSGASARTALMKYVEKTSRSPAPANKYDSDYLNPGLAAAQALTRIGNVQTAPEIFRLLGGENHEIESHLRLGIKRMLRSGRANEEQLLRELDNTRLTARRAESIIEIAGEVGSAQSLRRLIKFLNQDLPFQELKVPFCMAVANIGKLERFATGSDFEALADNLESVDDTTKEYSIRAMGHLPSHADNAYTELVVFLTRHAPQRLAIAACEALVSLKQLRAITNLEELLFDELLSPAVREAATKAVEKLKMLFPGGNDETAA